MVGIAEVGFADYAARRRSGCRKQRLINSVRQIVFKLAHQDLQEIIELGGITWLAIKNASPEHGSGIRAA
jgi:hypothetical protein